MNHKRPPLPAIFILVLIIGFSIYFIATQTADDQNGALTASGAIEAAQVDIAPELAGKVTEILVEEGQPVTKDSALLRLDPSLLTAQRAVASATVDSAVYAFYVAQRQYEQTLEAAIASENTQRARELQILSPSSFNQPGWYFDRQEQISAAQAELLNAEIASMDAKSYLNELLKNYDKTEIDKVTIRLVIARSAFLNAQDVKKQAEKTPDNKAFLDAANDQYEIAETELEDAQEAYDDLFDTASLDDIEYARGRLIAAEQRYYSAYSHWLSLQTGEYLPAVRLSALTVDQAQKNVAQAEASLALIDAQIAKLTVNAPMDGVILTRNVEPGEFVQPGAVALKLADLDNLTITVYVPEDRYGEITLGQTAEVSVDSFPDEVFIATVIHISDKAEFTPRNVQTVEGRSSTVYAIKLKVENADGKLKIGMPADIVFK
jgi:HlyD family secretion protein